MICNFGYFYCSKQKICAQRCGKIKLERMAIVEIILFKQSFCYTFPVISKAQNYRECMETKYQYLGITENGYQVQFISIVNLDLFVWFIWAKVYKVESCTVYFALNFHKNL